MSRKCDVSGKEQLSGMRYSFLRAHYNPTAKRKFNVNLQTIKTTVNGKKVKLKVATSVLKANPDIRVSADDLLKGKKRKNRKKLKKVIAELSA